MSHPNFTKSFQNRLASFIGSCAAATVMLAWTMGALERTSARELTFKQFEPIVEPIADRQVHWARAYSELELRDPGWRPLHVLLELQAPAVAPDYGVRVTVGVNDVPLRQLRVGRAPTSYAVLIDRRCQSSSRLVVQLWSETFGERPRGVGVSELRLSPVLASRRGLTILLVALLAGVVGSRLVPARAGTPERSAARRSALRRGAVAFLGVIAVGLFPVFWNETRIDISFGLWLAVLLLAAGGRAVRAMLERIFGPAQFTLYRKPVFEFFLGLTAAVFALYAHSFLVKRLLHYHDPLPAIFPLLLLAGALASLVWMFRGAGSMGWWTFRDLVSLATLFVSVSILGMRHFGTVGGYSTDPMQHIAWSTQLAVHGFVPDYYAGTRLLIFYPLAFHAYAYSLVALVRLPVAIAINILPVMASALFIYLLFDGLRSMWGPSRAERTIQQELADAFVFLAIAAAFSTAQFTLWNYYEGTARRSAGLVHIVPVLVIMDNARRAFHWEGEAFSSEPWNRAGALRMLALAGAGAGAFLFNPAHSLVHVVLTVVALASEALRLAREAFPLVTPGFSRKSRALPPTAADSSRMLPIVRSIAWLTTGVVAGALAAAVILLADPYSLRQFAKVTNLVQVDDAHVVRWETDYYPRAGEPSCLTLDCFRRAADLRKLAQAVRRPFRAVIIDPLRALGARLGLPSSGASAPGFFPGVVGFGAVTPAVHGLAPYLLMLTPIFLAAVAPLQPSAYWAVLSLLLVAAGIDLWFRNTLTQLINPYHGAVRLLLPYSNYASSVFFNQAIWTVVVAGIYLGLSRRTRPIPVYRALLALWIVGLTAVLVSAHQDLRDRSITASLTDRGFTIDDVRDLWELERLVPAGESYLIAARVSVAYDEKWIQPVDNLVQLYIHATRPTLFLFFQSHAARHVAADLQATCDQLRRGVRYPESIQLARARWMLVHTPVGISADHYFRSRAVCGVPVATFFPEYMAEASRGRLTLFRLW